MLVLKTSSPAFSPGKPNEYPSKTVPSSKAKMAFGLFLIQSPYQIPPFRKGSKLFHRPLVPQRRDSFKAQRPLREDDFSGESVRGPEPRGVQGLAPILQRPQACGHGYARKAEDF